ncbi:MAG: hypothetical protein QG588_769, partial [Candidatus Poribacteria bacterium]|nr:hypothetical protein [Candidatus Poribacteria bacterium]
WIPLLRLGLGYMGNGINSGVIITQFHFADEKFILGT